MAGWQKIYRDIQEHWLWEDKPFSRGQAWIDLILLVNHEDNKALIDGELMEVKRGSKITSLRKLAEQWGWSTTKVKKFLEQLKKDNMIAFESDNKKTLVTIENYDVYQGKESTEITVKKQLDNTEVTQKNFKSNSEVIQKKTNKNDKEYIKNDKECNKNDKECNKKEKEWEEGEEEKVPSLPPLSFPTQTHKKFYEQWGENSYRTWFMDAAVIEGEVIKISSSKSFKNEILRSNYKEYLEILTGKKVEIGD